MQTLAAFLISIAGSLAYRVLFALGFTVVSYAAFTALADNVVMQFQNQYSSIPGPVLQILNLGGVGQAFGIILGALGSRAALMAGKKLALK
jgi:hypothetical protein